MALNIRNSDTDRLATRLARLTGETKTEAVTRALRDRLARVERGQRGRCLADDLDAIALHCARLPRLDARETDDILGYDNRGIPR